MPPRDLRRCRRPAAATGATGAAPAAATGAPSAPAPAVPASESARYTAWFLAGDLDSLLPRFTPEMLVRVGGREGLSAFRQNVVATLGGDVSVGADSVSTRDTLRVHRHSLRGAATGLEAEIAWALDVRGAVAGFSVKPKAQAEAPSKYLGYASKTRLRLPFDGEWTAFSGGRTRDLNHHAGARNQRFALDLAIVRDGSTHAGDGSTLEQYHCWGAPALAPAAGTVVTAVDTLPDNPMGITDRENAAGNYVIVDHGGGEYSFLAHLQRGSLRVRPGASVAAGQPLGLVGNSGNTSEPHLHFHLQDGPNFPATECMPAAFVDYVADDVPVARGEPRKGQRIRNR
ncbi:MAG TPA: M23 family metallopeptidase [Acidobacteriota bacterium]|nr:M23 family metallopeptidase [Acidobacteriota bacterium]